MTKESTREHDSNRYATVTDSQQDDLDEWPCLKPPRTNFVDVFRDIKVFSWYGVRAALVLHLRGSAM